MEEGELKNNPKDIEEHLRVAEESLASIQNGEVDAIVVHGPKGNELYSLINQGHPFQLFIENMEQAAIILSQKGAILFGNRSFFELVGLPPDEVMGRNFSSFLLDDDKPLILEGSSDMIKTKSEFSCYNNKRGIRKIQISGFNGRCGDEEQACFLLKDITEFKRAQNLLEVSESVVKILSELSTISVTCHSILQVLNKYLQWEVLVVWVWSKEKQRLHCVEIAHIPGIDIEAFEKKTKEIEIDHAMAYSHVWSSYRPTCIEDVTKTSNFLRREEAFKSGLHGSVSFPFYKGLELAGVVELFRRAPYKETFNDSLFNLFSSMGVQIGLYLQRLFLNQTQDQITHILDLSANGVFMIDKNGIVLNWNPGAEKIYGWSHEEMIGSSIKKIFPQERLNEFEGILSQCISSQTPETAERERIHKDGRRIWVKNAYGPLRDPFGQVFGIVTLSKDITLEKTLIEREEKFKSYINITEDWIWDVDQEGIIRFSSPSVFKILGYKVDEVVGKNYLRFAPQEEWENLENLFQVHADQKKGWVHLNVTFLHKNGSLVCFETNATEILDDKGELIGFRGASRDVTEAKRLEKVKNEFISIISHELRTPLTAIYGALTLLTSKKLIPQEIEELISTAQRNSARLTNLINDIMDIEKIQLGKLRFNFGKVNIEELLIDSIRTSEIDAKKYNVKISLNEPIPEAYVKGDYSRLLQVMLNLLSNALKFSQDSGIVQVSTEFNEDKIRVSIRDYGPGISEDFQTKIFEKFAQADSSSKRAREGTGLGLSICKSIIEGHDGIIGYNTKVGEGTTFFFELPKYKGK